MKRAARQPTKQQTRAAKDGKRIKGLEAERTQSRADAVKSSGRIKGLVAERTQSRADAVKSSGRIKGLVADQKKSRAAAVQSADLLARMQAQQELVELCNEQLSESNASLELSRCRYADLYNLAPVGYLTLDGKGCIREINQTASQILGWSMAHLMGKPLLPHLAKPDRKVWLKHLWESRRSPRQIIITLQLQSKAGVVRKVQFATSREDTTGRRAAWCRTAMLDTTEKSDAQTALSASEAKFRLLAENMGEVFWFTELDPPRVTYVSPAVERVWGIPTSEIYADYFSWMRAIHPDDNDAVQSAFDGWMKSGSTTFVIQYRIIHRDGSTHWIADRGIVVSRRNGQPFEICGIAGDITERKLFEMALAEKASERKAILEGTHDGILIADAETRRFTFGNKAICRMLDVTPEELLRMGLESIHPHEALPYIREKFDAMARGELSVAENVPLLRKDGSSILVDITASPVVIKGRTCNIGVFHDISERRRAEEELRLRNTELRAKYNELERFNRTMVDRELRMIELKKEINALLAAAGQPPRFRVDFATLETSAPMNP